MRLTSQEDLIKIHKREQVFFENEVSGVNFNQINMELGLKYLEKNIASAKVCFSKDPALTGSVVTSVTHPHSPGVWLWGVVTDSEQWYPHISNSISQSSRIPRELLGEYDRYEPWNDTAVADFKAFCIIFCQICVKKVYFFTLL